MEISETIKEPHLEERQLNICWAQWGLYHLPGPQTPKKPPSQIRTILAPHRPPPLPSTPASVQPERSVGAGGQSK